MINILLINYEFPPIGGGGGNANYYILREYAKKQNIKVDLITSSETNEDYVERFSPNINIYRLKVNKKRLHYWTEKEILYFLYVSYRQVNILLRDKKYDLCHAFFGFPSGFTAYLFRKKIPYIISLRGSDVPGFNNRFSIQYIFLKPLFKKIWNGAKDVVANSNDLKCLALTTTPDLPIGVIHNGIDTEEFTPAMSRNSSTFTILTVSRLIQRKGLGFLIKALPEVLKTYPKIKLIIVGEGNIESDLKNIVKENNLERFVDFKGYVKHDQIVSIYKKTDVFVLPSLWEGMSNTILEAIASGLPVVITDTGGTKELINGNGIVISKENSNAIAIAVIKILGDPDLRKKMGEKSREIALNFSWAQVARKYLEIYEKHIYTNK